MFYSFRCEENGLWLVVIIVALLYELSGLIVCPSTVMSDVFMDQLCVDWLSSFLRFLLLDPLLSEPVWPTFLDAHHSHFCKGNYGNNLIQYLRKKVKNWIRNINIQNKVVAFWKKFLCLNVLICDLLIWWYKL